MYTKNKTYSGKLEEVVCVRQRHIPHDYYTYIHTLKHLYPTDAHLLLTQICSIQLTNLRKQQDIKPNPLHVRNKKCNYQFPLATIISIKRSNNSHPTRP